MNNTPITNYIKERIATLRKEQEQFSMNWGNYWRIDSIISELQAVLSKIEETQELSKYIPELKDWKLDYTWIENNLRNILEENDIWAK